MGIRIMCKYCKVEMSPRREVRLDKDNYGIVLTCPKCISETIIHKPKNLEAALR